MSRTEKQRRRGVYFESCKSFPLTEGICPQYQITLANGATGLGAEGGRTVSLGRSTGYSKGVIASSGMEPIR